VRVVCARVGCGVCVVYVYGICAWGATWVRVEGVFMVRVCVCVVFTCAVSVGDARGGVRMVSVRVVYLRGVCDVRVVCMRVMCVQMRYVRGVYVFI